MGQKVNPHGLRVGVIKDWDSRWFADKKAFGDILVEDYKVRNFIKEELKAAGIENFIHVRVNVLDTLKEFNAKLLK